MKRFIFSRKHRQIIKIIEEKGYYKPTYSDKEPATVTLEKMGIVKWRDDYRGVILTEFGKAMRDEILAEPF
jgi:hypothetical protein